MNDISEIKTYAQKNSVPIMQDESIEFICNYIKENDVKTVLEIGSAIGYSAICFANAGPDVKVTTIEIDIDRYLRAVQNIKDFNLEDRITIFHGDALVQEIEGSFDLIFIDAAKAQYIRFFERFKKNLSSGGVIITDNLSFHGMVDNLSLTHNYSTKKLVRKIKRYVTFLKKNVEYKTEFFPLGDRIAVTRKHPVQMDYVPLPDSEDLVSIRGCNVPALFEKSGNPDAALSEMIEQGMTFFTLKNDVTLKTFAEKIKGWRERFILGFYFDGKNPDPEDLRNQLDEAMKILNTDYFDFVILSVDSMETYQAAEENRIVRLMKKLKEKETVRHAAFETGSQEMAARLSEKFFSSGIIENSCGDVTMQIPSTEKYISAFRNGHEIQICAPLKM